MYKIIRIGTQSEYNSNGREVDASVYCKIEFKDKKLSISGVIDNSLGLYGQIYDSIEIDKFAKGWNKTKLKKFISIWYEWHLNNMNSYSLEMKKAGWDKLTSKKIFKYSYHRTDDCQKEFDKLEKDALPLLSPRQKRLLKSDRFADKLAYKKPKTPEFMKLKIDYRTKEPKIESQTLGWTSNKHHKDGLLGKKLKPTDENGYGTKWYFHEVPSEVIEFLESLPETDKQPAWIQKGYK